MVANNLVTLSSPPSRTSPSTFPVDSDTFDASLASTPAAINTRIDYIEGLSVTSTPKWVTGTTYAENDAAWSPVDFITYRAKNTMGSSTTDPASDSTNWIIAAGVSGDDQAKLDNLSVTSSIDLDQASIGHTFTADGAISAGEVVILKTASGKVAGVTQSGADANIGSADTVDANDARSPSLIFDQGDALCFYEDFASSNDDSKSGVVSGTAITWSSETDFLGIDVKQVFAATNGSGTICIFAKADDGSWGDLEARIGTWNGTSFTWGTKADVYHGTGASDQPTPYSICYDPVGDVFVLGYAHYAGTGAQSWRSVIVEYSGTTITVNSSQDLETGLKHGSGTIEYDPDEDNYVSIWNDNDLVRCSVGTLDSPTDSITWSTPITSHTGSSSTVNSFSLAYDTALNTWLMVWQDYFGISTSTLDAAILDPTGTPSMGAVINIDTDNYWPKGALLFDPVVGKFIFATAKYNSNEYYLNVATLTISGSVVTSSTPVIVNSENSSHFSIAHDSVSGLNWAVLSNGSSSALRSFNLVADSLATDANDWIGIASEAAVDAADVDVFLKGKIADGQTGLTIDTAYYVDDDGSLTTDTASGRKLGRAVTATEILITEGNAA